MKHLILFSFFIAFVFSSNAQIIEITSIPEWVHIQDTSITSQVNKYDIQSGFYYTDYNTISNYQKKTQFVRYKAKVINSSGVDYLSQINIYIDTSYQTLKFHELTIHRDRESINKTADIKFNLLNTESQLAENVYSGILNVNAVIPDLLKDDELEISYSVIGLNPVYNGEIHEISYLQDAYHFDRLTYSFIASKELGYQYKIKDTTNLTITQQEFNNNSILNVKGHHIQPGLFEDSMSPSTMPLNFIEITSFLNWNEVRQWAKGLFTIEESPIITSTISKICGEQKDKVKCVTKIVEYVQNKIRYTSINGGVGSFVASKPSEVLDRRYGDCKDKTLLLITLLNKLDVGDIVPALVNSTSGKNISDYLPGYLLFDHVIAKCKIDGKEIWIDPSSSLQGGSFDQRQSYDYGEALVLDSATYGPELMNILDSVTSTSVLEEFDLSDVSADCLLKVKTVFKGKNADYIRYLYDVYSPKDMEEIYKEVYSIQYNEVKTNNRLKIIDDYETNEIIMIEDYTITNPWLLNGENVFKAYTFQYEPANIYSYLSPTSCDSITYPIDLDPNQNYSQKTIMRFPENTICQLNNFESSNKAYVFSKNQELFSDSTTINYNFKMVAKGIEPLDYPDICKDINHDSRNLMLKLVWIENLPKTKKSKKKSSK